MMSIKILILALQLLTQHYHHDNEGPIIGTFSYALNEAICVTAPESIRSGLPECHAYAVQACNWVGADDVYDNSGVVIECDYNVKDSNDNVIDYSFHITKGD